VKRARERKSYWKTKLVDVLKNFMREQVATIILNKVKDMDPNDGAEFLEKYLKQLLKSRES
jgi:hypothetical protein